MSVEKALWRILEKTHFQDYSFTDEFIEAIKTDPLYDGLYIILTQRICSIFNIYSGKKQFKTTNSYPLVQTLVESCNFSGLLSEHEEMANYNKKIYDSFIDELEKMDELDEYHANSLILLVYRIERAKSIPHKYPELSKKYIEFQKLIQVIDTKNYKLIKPVADNFEEMYPGLATASIKHNITKAMMILEKKEIEAIAGCYEILFPTKTLEMYKDIVKFIATCYELQRLRLNNNYMYADYKIIPPNYPEFDGLFNHHIKIIKFTYEADMTKNRSNYINYLKTLINANSIFMTNSMRIDYLILLTNDKMYKEVYDIYNKHKKCIKLILRTNLGQHSRLNLIYAIVMSCFKVNKNCSIRGFEEILSGIDLNKYSAPGVRSTYNEVMSIIRIIKQRNSRIALLGFEIIDNSKIGETCLICMEEIEDSEIETAKCPNCKKEIGHTNCIYDWLLTKINCPNCRFKL